ncbi:sacsin N-terminal ATP-binding-like domain-containing protein [Thermomonospora umbrina]|uniref:Molecular chaperone Hsp90 n=1 Tax=Thermomonospora umbrina TaxID=111806 RepID=A0A3D9STR7_9ACTN|nr:hypothetical protein [Thermomonospora umbrina]REE96375.1 hypothetical protein DFJ69_1805 [Thermomonospora umbrina]
MTEPAEPAERLAPAGRDIPDPYRTRAVRDRVLAAWTASPARFREDANTEEDHALGGYRDRVIIELAQNAADAALRGGGAPGRIRFRLAEGVLTAANTGAPLDTAGVEALSTLRASAKRDEPTSVGRFGVGFAAVVAVSDEPAIFSTSAEPSAPGGPFEGLGGVGWSAARTRETVGAIPELAEELARRGGQVPVLRLPFAVAGGGHEPGFDTLVRLPLRDAEAEASVRRQLAEVGPALMLALPGLHTVEIEVDGEPRAIIAEHRPDGVVVIDGVPWRTVAEEGTLDPALLADRPTEERARPAWHVRWAVPEDAPGHGGAEAVLYAPTPSGERLDVPALLIASFPLAPDRRHVAPGPLTDFMIERAAEAYVRLLRELPATPALLGMVPGGLPAGELDARLRRAILERLPETPLLPVGPPGEEIRARGRDTVAVDGSAELLDLLGEVLTGLLPADWPATHSALAALGVRRLPPADVIDLLGGLDREPAWWRRLYAALAGSVTGTDSLGALPVPLADGRTVRGPRGLLIAAEGVDPESLTVLGLRFVHPGAVHPLLMRLGAVEAGPRAVLADPAVRAAAAGSFDVDDPEPVADAVLGLVAAAGTDPGDEPWLAELALPGADGDLYAAGELLFPGSPLREIMAADAPFGVVAAELVERWGEAPLEAAGVLRGFALVREEDVGLETLADDPFLDLDDEDAWARDVLARLGPQELPPQIPELTAVRDLELVDDWDAALPLLADPPLRAAVVDPVQVMLFDGRRVAVPSYTAWWLRRNPVLDGHRPADLRSAEAEELAGLYDVVPAGLDPVMLRALGVRRSAADLLAEPGGAEELLERLADPARTVPRPLLRRLWTVLADRAATTGEPLAEPPERVRALVGGVPEVVPAEDALVLDSPALLPLLADQPLVIAAYDHAVTLAEALDLSLASEEVPGHVESTGTVTPVPQIVHDLLGPGTDVPPDYTAHESLIVDGRPLSWWYDEDTGALHAADPAGLARALAWASGRWPDRLLLESVLRAPESLPTALAERDLEP